jgi:two-component system, sporulation sensor kinase E
MNTFIAVLKPTGEIIFVNNTPLELIGKNLADLEGELFYETSWWNYSNDITESIKRDIELCATGKTLSHEIEINTQNGLIWIDYSMHPVYDNHGMVKYLVSEGMDITKIKKAKKALQVEKNHLMTITENVPFGMVFIDKKGDYKYINPKFHEMFGYDSEDIPNGRAWFAKAFKNPEKRSNAVRAWKNDFKNALPGEKKPRTFQVTCKNGDSKIIEFVPVLLDYNEYLMTVEDVTERILAENALKQSEERFRTVASSAVDAIIITDLEGDIVFCNNSVQRIFGYDEDDILGESVNQFIPGRYLDEFLRKQEQFRLTGRHMLSGKLFESYGYRKDGSEFPIEISITAWETDDEKFTTSIIRDITERKLVEYELKSSEEKFRQMTENIQEVFWIIDPKMSQILYISPGYQRIWGRSRESLFDNPRSWIESIHPEDRKQVIETIFRSPFEIKSRKEGIQYRIIRPDGSIRWIYGKSFPLTDGGTKVKRIAGIAVDITKRVNAEEKYRSLFENINIGVIRCTVGSNSRLIDSNPKAMELFNYKKSEIMAIKASYLYKNGEYKIKFDEKVLKYGHVKNEKIEFKRQDGTPFNASVSAHVVKDEFENPKYIDCVIEDITSIHELEKYIKTHHPTISNSLSILSRTTNY